ncbi:hypothetical protein SAMN06298216_2822 [Spirosomataceae bacterium TFI 002]|nr:hypothetical protein SAMN06298216_2822 [Spirosomataceae bacterium TFI 002]
MEFWEWFEEKDERIREVLAKGNREQKKELTEEFDQFILELGRFSWEIIEEGSGFYTFIISPNRDIDLLLHSKNIIEDAPSLTYWSFLPAKPADKAMLNFEIYDEAVNLRVFQPSNWKVRVETNMPKSDITIHSTDFKNCDLDTCLFACEMALASFLGEDVYIHKVGKVKIAEEVEEMISFGSIEL